MRDEVETTPAAGRGRTFSKGYAACSFSPAIARRGSIEQRRNFYRNRNEPSGFAAPSLFLSICSTGRIFTGEFVSDAGYDEFGRRMI